MGYRIKKLPYKARQWKLQFVSYKDDSCKTRDIPETEWQRLGFHTEMSLDEAKARKDQLNAQGELKRIEERRLGISSRLLKESLVHTAYLGLADIKAFEDSAVFKKRNDPKRLSHWAAAKRCLCELRLDPKDWEDNSYKFYNWFKSRQLSLSYVQKVTFLINSWGKFISKRRNVVFYPVPAPRFEDRSAIEDAYFEKREHGGKSDQLLPEMLESQKNTLRPEHYNWLFISVWFGLRPNEIDNLAAGKHFKVSQVQGIPVLDVYQPKLTRLTRARRWKRIPCLYPEQKRAIIIVQSGKIERPSLKIMHDRFGERVHTYGGRQGFYNRMLASHSEIDVMSWMGHQSVSRGVANYLDQTIVRGIKSS